MAPRSSYGSFPNDKEDEADSLIFSPDAPVKQPSSCNWPVIFGAIATVLVIYPIFKYANPSAAEIADAKFGWIPSDELGLLSVTRNVDAMPSSIWGSKREGPLPTNSWYLVGHLHEVCLFDIMTFSP